MTEFIISNSITKYFKQNSNFNIIFDTLSLEFNNYSEENKYSYGGTILFHVCYSLCQLSLNEKIIDLFINYLQSTSLLNYSNSSTVILFFNFIYNKNDIYFYKKSIELLTHFNYYSFLDDHLISFYTHPEKSNLYFFQSIEPFLKHSSIQRLLYQNVRRNCKTFIYYITLRYNKYFNDSIIIDLPDIYPTIHEVLHNINYITSLFDDYTFMCKDEYNIILHYLF
jgi:hypothetical protein